MYVGACGYPAAGPGSGSRCRADQSARPARAALLALSDRPHTTGTGALMRRMAANLWSSFPVAIVAEGMVFSMLDPMAVFPGERHAALPPAAVYTLGFFLFWFFGALSGLLSSYLLAQPTGSKRPMQWISRWLMTDFGAGGHGL